MNKGIEQVLSANAQNQESNRNKDKQENTEKGCQAKELQLLKMHVILSKYLIRNKWPLIWICKTRESELLVNV